MPLVAEHRIIKKNGKSFTLMTPTAKSHVTSPKSLKRFVSEGWLEGIAEAAFDGGKQRLYLCDDQLAAVPTLSDGALTVIQCGPPFDEGGNPLYDKLHAAGVLDVSDENHQAGKGRDTLYRRITAARRFKLSPGTLDTLDLSPISLIVKDVRGIENAILYSGNALNKLLVQLPDGVATIDGECWGTKEAIARDYQIRWPKLQEITAPKAEVIDEEDGTNRPLRKKRHVLGVGPRGVRKYTLYSYSDLDTLYCPNGILIEGDRKLVIPAVAKRELGIQWETIRRAHEYGHENLGGERLPAETRFRIGPRGAKDYEFFDKALLSKIKEPKAKRARRPLGRTATKRRQEEGEATVRIGVYGDGATRAVILPEISWLYHEARRHTLSLCLMAGFNPHTSLNEHLLQPLNLAVGCAAASSSSRRSKGTTTESMRHSNQ